MNIEKRFELPRGVREVEVRHGFAQVHVDLDGDLPKARIDVLKGLAEAGISHKYLKLTQNGLALIITDAQVEDTRNVLNALHAPYELNAGRSVILVHAIGMREEPGMLARILQASIACGISADHIGDMHDKMFMVVRSELAEQTARNFEEELSSLQSKSRNSAARA